MKKIISFVLAALLLVSAVPMAHATNDYTAGTAVVYTAANTEAYTVTVPAQLAPGGSGTVTLEGTWAANRIITVTAEENVKLTNSINEADTKTLTVTFPGISEAGSNTEIQKFTETVSVANISDAIFGTWSGKFNYNVETKDKVDYDSIMRTIIHRGYNKIAPENTIPAFELAKDYGFKYVEADPQFTSDGIAVLCHDTTIDRTSDGTGTVSEMTYDEVSQYDFGSWKSSTYEGTKIPTFEEFISWCKDNNMHPYIDAKTLYSEEVLNLLEIVEKHDMQNNVTWCLGIANSLRSLAAADPDARIAFLVTEVKPAYIALLQEEVFRTNSVLFSSSDYSSEAVALCKEANIPLEVWCINDTNVIASLDSYITGVTSDFLNVGKYLYNNTPTDTATPPSYEVVAEIASSDIKYGYTLAASSKHYIASSAGRATYAEFDIPIEEGYYYKFDLVSSAPDAQIGISFVSENGLLRVENGLGCGQANVFDTGFMNSGVEIEAPININGSPAKAVRFNFYSNDTSVTEDYIISVIISKKPIV